MGKEKIKVIKKKERKTFIKGSFTGKYYGFVDENKKHLERSRFYDINVYEGEISDVNLISESTYNKIDTEVHFLQKHFNNVVSTLNEKVGDFDGFRFNIHEPKVESIKIKDVTKDDGQTFGTFTCTVYGYLIDLVPTEEEIYVDVCDVCNKAITECDCPRLPEKITEEDKDHEEPPIAEPAKNEWPVFSFDGCFQAIGYVLGIGFLILLLFVLGPKFIPVFLVLAALYFLFTYIHWISSFVLRLLDFLIQVASIIVFIFFVFTLISIFRTISSDSKSFNNTKPNVVKNEKEEKATKSEISDSIYLISHKRIWQDYNRNEYQGNLSVLESDYINSRNRRNSINLSLNNNYQWTRLYSSLINSDKKKLDLVIKTFDSIGKANQLGKMKMAEMIVSCIQDIPYALVLADECSASTNNERFIQNHLEECPNCCIGNIKYGLQSPAEFVANLKGDCDTRTVMLFLILSKFGYDVAVLGSIPYRHSILAINLPYSGLYKRINGEKYYVWETTSTGFEPGILNPSVSNMELWDVHLINNKK
ncbi:hypothetical protein [uncultured Winogradskyella sp.]|uniref:hypothetical protein n=1 Tax=uncultured Winogradskyella sp. TaxID=395353 RepID=UPI003515FD91